MGFNSGFKGLNPFDIFPQKNGCFKNIAEHFDALGAHGGAVG